MIRDTWPWVTAAFVIAGLVLGSVAVIALGFAVGLVCFVASLWARYALARLEYERVAPEDHAFTGETFRVELRLTNRKPLPLPWVEVRDDVPEQLVRAEDATTFRPMGQYRALGLDWRTSVAGGQRVRRTIELRAPARGLYPLGPAVLRSGDPFGLFTEERVVERPTPVVVYPRTYDLPELRLPARRPYGERAGAARLFEDPLRIAGVRDYRPGDPLRRIDWKATARRGALQSRVYEPAATRHLLICLNTQTVVPAWAGYIPELLERSVSVAASLARDAYDRRDSAGLIATCSFPEADRAIRIAPGGRPEQFVRILEALAVINPFVLEPLAEMLDREEHRLNVGTTMAVVSAVMTDDLGARLDRLQARGHAVVLLATTREALAGAPAGIDARDLSAFAGDFRPPETVTREALAQVLARPEAP
jgi:uncharacterized protein (DUF58 family)